MPVFCIQGNIGAGKTSFLQALERLCFERGVRSKFFPEDVAAWEPWLRRFYASPKSSAAVSVQLAVVASYQKLSLKILRALEKDPETLIVVERSPMAVERVFLEANKDGHEAIEHFRPIVHAVFHDDNTDIGRLWNSAINVYLKVPARLCLERAEARSRESEKGGGLTLEYLEMLERLHGCFEESDGSIVLKGGDLAPSELAQVFLGIVKKRLR